MSNPLFNLSDHEFGGRTAIIPRRTAEVIDFKAAARSIKSIRNELVARDLVARIVWRAAENTCGTHSNKHISNNLAAICMVSPDTIERWLERKVDAKISQIWPIIFLAFPDQSEELFKQILELG